MSEPTARTLLGRVSVHPRGFGFVTATEPDERTGETPSAFVAPPELNRFLAECGQARQPPAKQGHRLKLLYMAQIGERPPRFAIQVNSRNRVTRDYAYFLENRLRARYGMDGVPLIIDFNERTQRRSEVRSR